MMGDFRDLKVWQKSHALELNIHKVGQTIRRRDFQSLRTQLIRSSESISATIVESRGQQTRKMEISFLWMSVNSANETEHHLENAKDKGAIGLKEWERLTHDTIEVRKMLRGLIKALKQMPDN
jgi:four helix bundle protein